MKKILKKLIYQIKNTKLITKIFLIILLLVGGGLTANHFVQKEMDEEVRHGDKNHHIKTITYQWNTVKHNLMGGFMLDGYVNGDKTLDIGIAFDKDSGKIECRLYKSSSKVVEWKGFK